MGLMQNYIPDKTTPSDVQRMVLSRPVYLVAEKFGRGQNDSSLVVKDGYLPLA